MPPTKSTNPLESSIPQDQPPSTQNKYIYPSETTLHKATILSLPSKSSTFPLLYKQTYNEILTLAATIALFEPVRLHVRPEEHSTASEALAKHLESATATPLQKERITLIPVQTNHVWVRDTGPVYVRGTGDDPRRYAIDFGFCEWGNKLEENIYVPTEDKIGAMKCLPSSTEAGADGDLAAAVQLHPQLTPATAQDTDEANWPIMDPVAIQENHHFAQRVLEIENTLTPSDPVTRIVSRVKLEGGGIEVDGEGTFLATASSILVPSRNAGLSRTEVERELSRLLGVTKFIWIPGREGLDITDCHIDAEARFVRPGVVVCCKPHPSAEEIYWEMYREMRSILEHETDAQGRRFEIHDIQDPDPGFVKTPPEVLGEEDVPAASYVNFYFVNGGLVVPAFGDGEADRAAVELLQGLLPERDVVQVLVNALPRTGGVLHCTTQQVI